MNIDVVDEWFCMGEIGIVGGSGFVGSALARRLSKSFKVKVLDRKPIPKPKEELEFQRCDIRKYGDVERGLRDVEVVVHAAIVQIPLINEEKRLGYEVNVLGTQNVCEVVDRNPLIKGMILTGSWHVIGERELRGVIDEEFGFRPDKVEDRARLYALCKIAQESIVRVFDEVSEKVYGVIRIGTALGSEMPEKTAASIFISNGLEGKPLTPFRHSMYRPMLYVDVGDVCKAFEVYVRKILNGEINNDGLSNVVNLYWPKPITILELAGMVRDSVTKYSEGRIKPEVEVVDRGKPILFTPKDKNLIKVDISRVKTFLGLEGLTNPRETVKKLVSERLR
jgi:nucleoside-diphosphate-sugar epimerase